MMKKIKLTDINSADLFAACQKSIEPLLITDIYDIHPRLAGWSPEFLQKKLTGSRQITVRTGNSYFFDVKAGFLQMEFNDYLQAIMLDDNSTIGPKLYMQQQSIESCFPELLEDLSVEAVLPQSILLEKKLKTYKKLWIGPGGSTTPLHFDLYDNYFIQMYGKKTFYLFNPFDLTNLYPYGPFTDYPYVSKMDPLNPNLSKFPKSIKAKIHEVTLEPGCILYLPSYWLHQVQGDVASLNVSVNIWLSRGVFKLVPGFFNILPAYLKRNILSRF
jgi:hypothetical protein